MGRSSSRAFEYSYARGEKKEGQTRIYRHPFYKNRAINDDSFITQPQNFSSTVTMREMLLSTFDKFKEKEMLFSKRKEFLAATDSKGQKPKLDEHYSSRRYNEGRVVAGAVIKFIEKNKLYKEVKCTDGRVLRTLGVLSRGREEWLLLDFACQIGGYTLVAINEQFPLEELKQAFLTTDITTVFCSEANLKTLTQPDLKDHVANVICFDDVDPQKKDLFKKGLFLPWSSILRDGSSGPDLAEKDLPRLQPSDSMTIVFTRNFQGKLKAVLLSHENFTSAVTALEKSDLKISKEDVYLSYLPITSVYERVNLLAAVFSGASIYFSSGNLIRLRDEIQEVSPTIFAAVPRFYERLYQTLKGEKKAKGCKGYMESRALKKKKKKLKENNKYSDPVTDALFFKDKRLVFGKRIRLLISGSAKLSPKVANYLRVTASCPLVEGYGCTQTTSVVFLTNIYDKDDSIGGPLLNCEFKLVDPPESFLLGKKRMLTTPRGELCIRGPCCTPYVLEANGRISREGFDEQGFFHTGDYAEMDLEKGSLKIIDRIHPHFKLNNGEFVSPGKLEAVFRKSEKISNIFVYGDSSRSDLIAIVNLPSKGQADLGPARSHAIKKETAIKLALKEEFDALAETHRLAPFERIREIHIEDNDFDKLKLVFVTGEIKRREAVVHFRQMIENIYNAMELN